MKKQKIYTIYLLDKVKNDLKFEAEYLDIEQLKADYNIKNYNYNKYIATYDETKDTYNIQKVLHDKYVIIKTIEEL